MKEIFEIANNLALEEIEKFGGPSLSHYNLALQKGEKLAATLGADVEVVKLGCALMDVKLGECIKNEIQPQHVQKSYEYANQILCENNVSQELKQKVLDCVKCHHGTPNGVFPSLEAEICANADCYRFIHPQGVMTFLQTVTKRGCAQNDAIDAVLAKLEEKHNIMSLPIVKKELEPLYEIIKKLLQMAKI